MSVTHAIKRNGQQVPFESEKIKHAIVKAFLANGNQNTGVGDSLTKEVVAIINGAYPAPLIPKVEEIQDVVECVLIKNNHLAVARAYIVYRERHKELRQEKILSEIREHKLNVTQADGTTAPFDERAIADKLSKLSFGLNKISVDTIVAEVCKTVFNGIPKKEVHHLILNAIKGQVEDHYQYGLLASRYLLNKLYRLNLKTSLWEDNLPEMYQSKFADYVKKGIELGLLNPALANFDLSKLASALNNTRDLEFHFLGMQTLADRYLLRDRAETRQIFELPQWMWMRVAMGLALKEQDKEKWAIEFYNTLSQLLVVTSTPTLFNSGTTHSQMSSCYVNVVEDSMTGIFKTFGDCAQLSKWAGGIGTDWTKVRSKGAKIVGTNGESQGIVPFLKIYNDIALAVNQGGKRKGAMTAYLEVWHADLEEFLELKKNTGDERRRTHDIHTACMIPDLFMKRVKARQKWTLFSPSEAPDLHNLYGKQFEERYEYYESQNLPSAKQTEALEVWKKMLTMLYETGHPWITFKDALNVRNPQSHKGVIHSSNLCTEIALNTSKGETAVCNLASINLSKMVLPTKAGQKKAPLINEPLLAYSVGTAMRMLDNVIDNNFYPIPEAEQTNSQHRPVGLGMMGYQDALYQMEIDFDSEESLVFADESMEAISYHAILASSRLAKEKGTYVSYEGSKWSTGIFPLDSLTLLEKERGVSINVNRNSKLDWAPVREHVAKHGMRNSHCLAIAPTATISNISGTTPCVEPTFKNIYMKENLSGNFMVINRYLVDALEGLGLWSRNILTRMKINNGSILEIDEIPAEIRRRFKETFEIDSSWILKGAALRGKWIDQSASTNIFIKTRSGKAVNDFYLQAWEMGLKTTYYLRTLAESQVTKTASDELTAPADVDLADEDSSETPVMSPVSISTQSNEDHSLKVCSISDPDCEACQ